ncbi:MAG TPA: SusC/RagA family TonB-linked outer membrane protein [Gemmatimonadaceae bacterium]|nr:SusC/RagA family TonB-linked outer membrane protein [Gemmatimonadaceae bacterium]
MRLRKVLGLLALAVFACPSLSIAQGTGSIRGRVTDATSGGPLAAVQISIEGTRAGAQSGSDGNYSINGIPTGPQTLVVRRVGYSLQRIPITVGAGVASVQNIALKAVPTTLNEVTVTALGETIAQRSLGTAQQAVKGSAIAETQRENFVNALQGRVAGVQVVSSSGVPGASSSITIRGISSISGSNQPLMIIDGLPMDNKTLNTGVLASDAPGSTTAFSNRGVDFTNRAADLNPEDIETLVVLKGPEASALYGIDAANGAIVITTKRGKSGKGGFEYSNSFRIENTRSAPEIQRVYGPQTSLGSSTFLYYGPAYGDTAHLYNNIDGFFQTALTQKHNLAFSGASQDNKINYRVATSTTNQEGVVPNNKYDRVNVTGASQAQVTRWLNADLSMGYTYANNRQSFKGDGGPLIGLLVWPSNDDAKNFLNAAGQRRRVTTLAQSAEVDNPYFNVNKNQINSKNNRIIANLGLKLTPFSWGNLKTNIGTDSYTNQNLILRHPESVYGFSNNGIIDVADDITRNLSAQTLLNFNPHFLTSNISVNGLLGHSISDFKSTTDASKGSDFLDPNFVSVNNANQRTSRSSIAQRRLVSAFGSMTLSFKELLYLTVTGRNDWTSTIPQERNSFFYPSISSSFVFSDAFPAIGRHMTGKLRAAYAEVGKDARPYAFKPALEFKTTTNGGYGYGFTGPNFGLKPEFARSYEVGTELSFLHDRLGFDATFYRKQTKDQIVNDIRGSYATGYILFNLNGAETRNQGLELTLRATPVLSSGFSWDVLANFESAHGKTLALPHALPESYVSDTWLFGNVRNGTAPGLSTQSLTGLFYLRNNAGKILIDPTSGLPIRSTVFIDHGYDRTPDFTIGLTNNLKRGPLGLSFLWDIRKGGDVFNATEQFLTARGLSPRTLDRWEPRVVDGVLRDGKENSDTPTQNTIVVVPAVQTGYYTGISEELFIEKNINWLRLRDITLSYALPARLMKNASVYLTGTDLFLWTNYSGLDPIVNGNTAAVGGSGAAGIDYGNFPIPRGINFGIKLTR